MHAIILILLVSPAKAKTVAFPSPVAVHEIGLSQIEADMRAAGHQVVHTMCGGAPAKCEVTLPPESTARAQDLAPFFSNAKTRSQKKAEATAREQAIIDKLKAGTATQPEIAEIVEKALGRR
jgi:hypothetical protein